MKRKWLVILAASALGIAALAFYSLQILFDESMYTSRGTYSYWIAVSSVIRNVPEVGAVGEARFHASPGDGPKLPDSTVTYRSQAPPDQIRSQIADYLTRQGYQRSAGRDDEFTKGYSIVTITIKLDENGRDQFVKVSEVF